MSSLVETCPLNRDIMSQAAPSMNTYKSSLYSHQRYFSGQLTYNALPQPVMTSKLSQPSLLNTVSINKKQDYEPKVFQTPSPCTHVKSSSQQLDSFLNDIKQNNRSHTRASRIYTMDDIKSQLNVQSSSPSDNQQQKATPTITTPSPLLQQFGNMDLRKRISLAPIKPVEMNFDQKLELNLGSKFRNLKTDDQSEENDNQNEQNSDIESPIERKSSKYLFVDNYFDDNYEEDLSMNDQDESEEDLSEDITYENYVFEIKSTNSQQLKSILKKPSQQKVNLDDMKRSEQNYSFLSSNSNNLNLQQSISLHLRSNSQQIFPNYNFDSIIEQSPTKNQYFIHSNSLNTPDISKCVSNTKAHIQRSQSLNGYVKKVTFMISQANNELFQSDNGSLISSIDLYSSPSLSFSQQNSSSPSYNQDNQINQKKSNHFSRFYTAFKNNLNSSKAEILSSSQDNSSLNNSNSTNITVSTVNSLSSLQFSQFQTLNTQESNLSSGCSTPVASQQNINSPITHQQDFENRNPASSKNLLSSVFKDMKLTKNTKVYFDTKIMNDSPNSSNNDSPFSFLSTNKIGQSNSDTQIGQKSLSDFTDIRRNPSIDFFNFNS